MTPGGISGHKAVAKIVVPAGQYFLGDPCYAVPNDQWHALLDSCDTFEKPIGTVGGHTVVAFRTAYGDGTYLDQRGVEYPVDAGLIGLTPMSLSVATEGDGNFVVFNAPAECWNNDGILHFGDYVIDTLQDDEVDE